MTRRVWLRLLGAPGIANSGRCDDEEVPAKSYARRARSIADPGGVESQGRDHRNGCLGAGGGTAWVPALLGGGASFLGSVRRDGTGDSGGSPRGDHLDSAHRV